MDDGVLDNVAEVEIGGVIETRRRRSRIRIRIGRFNDGIEVFVEGFPFVEARDEQRLELLDGGEDDGVAGIEGTRRRGRRRRRRARRWGWGHRR